MRHARQRLEQRCNTDLSIREVNAYLSSEEPLFLKRLTTSRSLVCLPINGEWLFAVIDRKKRSVITMLTDKIAAGRMRVDVQTLMLRVQDMQRKETIPIDNTPSY